MPIRMSMETPGVSSVMRSCTPSFCQISPCPSKTNQHSLTVAWTVARVTWYGGTVLWIILPPGPSIRNRISAPAGDFASGNSGSGVDFIFPPFCGERTCYCLYHIIIIRKLSRQVNSSMSGAGFQRKVRLVWQGSSRSILKGNLRPNFS